MTDEMAFDGVFIANAPVTACLALMLALVCHLVLMRVGAYRWIWHPVLFDTALFVLFWALIALIPPSSYLPAALLPATSSHPAGTLS